MSYVQIRSFSKKEGGEKVKAKITQISKSFKRVLTDGNYGSFAFGTEMMQTVEVNSAEELKEANEKLSDQVMKLTMIDIKNYMEAKKEKKVW
jgi:hypothetical protein